MPGCGFCVEISGQLKVSYVPVMAPGMLGTTFLWGYRHTLCIGNMQFTTIYSLAPRPSSLVGKTKARKAWENLSRDRRQSWEHGWAPMHSEHANMGLPKLLHLLHTQGGQLTRAAVQLLLILFIAAPNASFGGCVRSNKSFLPPFYPVT
jgi:hypothetical protein